MFAWIYKINNKPEYNNAEELNPFIEKMISKEQDAWNDTDRKLSNMLIRIPDECKRVWDMSENRWGYKKHGLER